MIRPAFYLKLKSQSLLRIQTIMATSAVPLTNTTTMRPKARRKRFQWAPILFLLLPLLIYFIWIIGPTIATGVLAGTNWDGVGDIRFFSRMTGEPFLFRNFNNLFKDPNFWTAFSNNIRWLLFFMLIPATMGLAMAMVFNTKFPGARFFKIAFYSPLVLAGVVTGLIWGSMYQPDGGLINAFLVSVLGFSKESLPLWLGDQKTALWCIIFAAAWRQVGYVMILYLAGLKGLDTTLIEAATVDGANHWDRFRFVVLPLLQPVTVVVIVISIIDSLRAFDLVRIMTKGGPNYSSEVMANFMYTAAFNNYEMGYAATIAVTLFSLMLLFIVPYLIYTAKTELEY